MKMIMRDLTEPYPISNYRYFVDNWPQYAIMVDYDGECIGCAVSKLDWKSYQMANGKVVRKKAGYINMLCVELAYRRIGLGRILVQKSMELLANDGADEILLEVDVDNKAAYNLYMSFGFVKYRTLKNFYLSGNDADSLRFTITK